MIKQVMSLIFAVTIAPLAFGETKPCENYAKYAAIKAYKTEMGTVQGSDGIEYAATLLKKQGQFVEYKVTISDNNEDGEIWDVDYRVQLQMQRDSVCKILKVQKIEVESALDSGFTETESASNSDLAVVSAATARPCKKEAEKRAIEVFTSNGTEFSRDLRLVTKFNTVYANKIHWDVYIMKGQEELSAYGIGLDLMSPRCRALSVVDLNYHSDWE